MPCNFRGPQGDQAVLGSAIYEDLFVRRPEGWRPRRMTLTSVFCAPWERGWIEQRFVGVNG